MPVWGNISLPTPACEDTIDSLKTVFISSETIFVDPLQNDLLIQSLSFTEAFLT